MVRTTNHKTVNTNAIGIDMFAKFHKEYRRIARIYLNYLWNRRIDYVVKNKPRMFDIQNNQLDVPGMLSNPMIEELLDGFTTNISARARKCCLTQVLGMIQAVTKKQQKRIWQFAKTPTKALETSINNTTIGKPKLDNINPELNSICTNFQLTEDGKFTGFIELTSIGKHFGKIRFPINFHRRNKKYSNGKLLSSFLFRKDSVDLRWEVPRPEKQKGVTIGADQGINEILTLSDGQTTETDLSVILKQIARKRRGSKAQKRKLIERDNLIRARLNRLNFSGIGKVKFEQVKGLRKGKRTGAFMSHWTYALIEKKMQDLSETEGFVFQISPSAFKSQRCSGCGLVQKSNRVAKQYHCHNCGLDIDADLNAAKNHEVELPTLPFDFREKNGIPSFFWNERGVFDLDGVELQSHSPKIKL